MVQVQKSDEVGANALDKNVESILDHQGCVNMGPIDYTGPVQGDGACASSTGATPRRTPRNSIRNSIASSSTGHVPAMINNYLPPYNENNNEEELATNHNPTAFNSGLYNTSSDDSSDNECRIIPDVRDDYLETLDRKVTEVINQSRISNGGIVGGAVTADLNRKSSGSRRHHRNKPSPGSAKRLITITPPSSDNLGNVVSSSNYMADDNSCNGNTIFDDGKEEKENNTTYLPTIVRFDEANGNNDQDRGSDTQESSQDRWSDGEDAESEGGENLDDRNIIKRRR